MVSWQVGMNEVQVLDFHLSFLYVHHPSLWIWLMQVELDVCAIDCFAWRVELLIALLWLWFMVSLHGIFLFIGVCNR
ncbi:unnamed protein product [Linum tenue]|uniref:Uncharacterized protein n=1 Tax=Linum tenue TaxID=586396 RepID=A0AAV0KV30_9ROSI|nr:unnamed protein product [Linum tenue]